MSDSNLRTLIRQAVAGLPSTTTTSEIVQETIRLTPVASLHELYADAFGLAVHVVLNDDLDAALGKASH